VTMKNGVFWVVTPCGSCKNRRFGGIWRLLHQGDKNRWTRNNTCCNYQPTYAAKKYQVGNTKLVFLRSVRRLLVAACVVHSSPIFCHPDEGGARFLRNVGSYKSHKAYQPRRHHSSKLRLLKYSLTMALCEKYYRLLGFLRRRNFLLKNK
jgi:hypothetical protein